MPEQKSAMKSAVTKLPRRIATGLIRLYQWTLNPLLGGNCRFYPSCSQYGIEAVEQHGALRGSWMTVKRICKCHPLHEGGVDLVPPAAHPKRG